MVWTISSDNSVYMPMVEGNKDDLAEIRHFYEEFSKAKLAEGRLDLMLRATTQAGLMDGGDVPVPDHPVRYSYPASARKYRDRFPVFQHALGAYAIPEHIINIIEKIEPGVHRYLPTEITYTDGQPFDEKRWLLQVRQRVETMDLERSELAHVGKDNFSPNPERARELVPKTRIKTGQLLGATYEERKAMELPIFCKKDLVKGRAIWFEDRYKLGRTMISDEFAEALRQVDYSGLLLQYHIREID